MDTTTLIGTQGLLVTAFGTLFLAWLGISVYAVASHVLDELLERSVRSAGTVLDPVAELAPGARRGRLAELLGALPRRSVERVAADAATPDWIALPFARYAAARWSKRLLGRALAHGGDVTKWRRIAALRILARAHVPAAVPLLERALCDGDRDVVEAAVGALGSVPERRAGAALVDALRRRVHSLSRIAAQLDDFPLDLAGLIRPLATAADPKVRFWAATLLARYASVPAVADDLVSLTLDADADVRAAAVESVGKVDSADGVAAAVASAQRLLSDEAWFVRSHAARTLGALGAVDAAPRITEYLSDRRWWVRTAAKDALVALGPGAVPAAVASLDSADRFERNSAVEVLQNLGYVDGLLRGADDAGADVLLEKLRAAGGARLLDRALAPLDGRRRGVPAAISHGVPAPALADVAA